ncbi:secreted protein [Plakobranchus ocellatus]|uniref:Secreted protein n=1 Tax=Plakobranchus ocellatus TaxID=259542 RepID=A0AAV4AKH1_9GAST|nr:secreted protein [Plakobranchus ocellatus]
MKTSEQRKILEERHSVPIMRHSIYNLQQKMGVGRVNGDKDDVKCEAIIRDIMADHGYGEVGRDEEGGFQYCCFTTTLMKGMLQAYPETIIMDFTYKRNQYLYPCMIIMILDGEGQGQPVFHAFVAREDKTILENCLCVFAQQYDTTNTRCCVVEKDMAEIAAIGAVFPGVPVLLCHFHISQAVERYLKGKVSKAVADIVLDSFMNQMTTESDDEFLELKRKILEIIP